MKWETVIGVEVHIETDTKTKMFCACSAQYFGARPNSHVCPVCLGLPGALPFTNQEAIDKCIKIGLALGCKINTESVFERKNYFYPDLSKGYQISQYRWPLCVNGSLEINGRNGKRQIRINRAHQEEDTGKLSHKGSETFIDFNRSGVPLVEIVTEADFRDSSEVRDYGKKLQAIIRSLGVSQADMEKGDMRLEANVSVRPLGQKELAPYRVELKNINSFKFISDAIDFEVDRQIKLLEKGESIPQQTRGYNEDKKETFLQRSKEEANDYRYFPEPDLLPIIITDSRIREIKSTLTELLPAQLVEKYQNMGVSSQASEVIASSQSKTQIFNQAINKVDRKEVSSLANFMLNQGSKITSTEELLKFYELYKNQKKELIQDENEIRQLAQEIIIQNKQAVSDYKTGKLNALQILIGQIMKKTQSKVDPKVAIAVFEKLLTK